jgi:putative polymerase
LALEPFSISRPAEYGFESIQVNWENDLSGRLLWTARLLTSLSFDGMMGIAPNKPFLSDSGYAYSLNEIGLVGFVFYWGIFIFSGPRDPVAWRFRACIATYISLLLIISDSTYTIKTAALLWFMLGSSDGGRVSPGRSSKVAPVVVTGQTMRKFRISDEQTIQKERVAGYRQQNPVGSVMRLSGGTPR